MLALKVEFKYAEIAKLALIEKGLMDKNYELKKDAKHIYFPITGKAELDFPNKIVQMNFDKRENREDWKSKLVGDKSLTQKQAELMVKSFDVMGDIAIIEIPEELEKAKKRIADALLKMHSNLKVVAKKGSEVSGKFRVRKLEVLAGENRTETVYRESGCAFEIDLAKVYYSPRLSFERERIAKKVKKGETVLALFAGAGFFPIVICKYQPKCKIVAVELNPVAVKYMEKNIARNKMETSIKPILGDVKKVLGGKKFRRWANRTTLPLPHSAYEFLAEILDSMKKGGIVHFYYIPKTKVESAFKEAIVKIKKACNEKKRKFKVVYKRIVKTYAPHVDEVVIDFKLLN
ncbi:class I SAM-dependent methyltransferase family protein [Candidatus Micrarchaeota archaeon]|nr:class I SAM-dependent methyltransferase family protein [Candidatus Micrarchaeota archaeon]